MATPNLLSQLQLERRFGPGTVRDFADLTGDGSSVATRVEEVLREASGRMIAILRKGWADIEQIQDMCLGADADPDIVGAGLDIAIAILARGRSHTLGPDGVSMYASFEAGGEKRLRAAADGATKPDAERTVGANRLRSVGLEPNRPEQPMVFAATRDNPRGPGGF
jgi:hypothetical protein